MSDFYAVLKQSMIDRALRSPDDRDFEYAQARAAIIRRLWTYEPPLSEDEIDGRIGQFDLAVERIEGELVRAFAEDAGEFDDVDEGVLADLSEAPPALYDRHHDGDPDAGYQPAAESIDPEPDMPDAPAAARRPDSAADLFTTLDARSLAVEQALNSDTGEQDTAHDLAALTEDEPLPPSDPIPTMDFELRAADISPSLEPELERAEANVPYDIDSANPGTKPVNWYRPQRETKSSARPKRKPARSTKPVGKTRQAKRSGQQNPDSRRLIGLIVAVAALAVALLATVAYVLAPQFTASSDLVSAAPPTLPEASSGTTAPPPADTLQRFTLFDGRDPTVFEAAPGNPVRFNGEAARISTSAGSAGASVAIGPGMATRLAGHNVRITVMARTVPENGALNMRIAYQSGLAVSHWRMANLTSEFAPVELVWRVPALRTDPNGGAIIIEPGIPGDGTAVEIGSITVDLLD